MEKYFAYLDCTINDEIENNISDNIRYINIDFDNNGHQGLFNKIIYLSGLVRYCLKNKNVRLIEPLYKIGVNHHTLDNKGILFSDIFDINFFNKKMENIFYMVPNTFVDKYNLKVEILPHDYANIYGWNIEHEEYINIATKLNKISINDNILLKVLDSLRLNENNIIIFKDTLNILGNDYNAIHMRTESDWPNDWEKLSIDTLVSLYNTSCLNENKTLFYSTGESHEEIKNKFNDINIKNHTFQNSNLLYDLKTAISYTICLFSNKFIGNTYSTFSSLISMQRELIYKNTENFSYNNSCIYKRLDKGLHYKKCFETYKDASSYVEILDSLPKTY